MNTKNYQKIVNQIPSNVKLVAVSKTQPLENILAIYNSGQRIFGENRPLDLRDRYEALPKDIDWHFIGHLQTNKIKYIIPFVKLIHSIDSIKLLKNVNNSAQKHNRVVDVLLQFHIADETTKQGFQLTEIQEFIKNDGLNDLKNVNIVGVMGMATNTDDINHVRTEFKNLKNIFNSLKEEFFSTKEDFKEISMGMTNDYHIAIEEGSTIVRVGRAIFNDNIEI
ncbi:MAG: YggS family pyridoxal phosphate-dependent enzyme [Bacteroidales bacterium]|jgi:pyridoxal phosphate enzyme (YggS family)